MSVSTSTVKDTLSKTRHADAPVHPEADEARTSAARKRSAQLARARGTGNLLAMLLPLLLALVLLVSWYVSTANGLVNSLFLPTPADVFASLSDGIVSGMYLSNTLVTMQESVLGFLLALAIALPLGYGLAKSRLVKLTLHPYLVIGQAIPAIVIAPLFVLWFDYGWTTNMLICVLVVLFPLVMNTILGLQTIDPALTDAARVEGASGWSLLSQIEFPLALPAILTAIRTGFTLSIVGALVGEFVQGGDKGLGSLVLLAKNQYNTPFMFSTLVVLAVLAALYYTVTWILTKVASVIY